MWLRDRRMYSEQKGRYRSGYCDTLFTEPWAVVNKFVTYHTVAQCQWLCYRNIFLGRAGFKTVGGPGQDIFRGDVSCQTHFFRGGGGFFFRGGGDVAHITPKYILPRAPHSLKSGPA